MNWFHRIFRRRLYDDLGEELRQHIEEKTEQLMRTENLSRTKAEQAARRAFGNVTLMEQRSRETWQWPAMESIVADIRFALRQIRRSPGFSVAVILLLTLGIGFFGTLALVLAAVGIGAPFLCLLRLRTDTASLQILQYSTAFASPERSCIR